MRFAPYLLLLTLALPVHALTEADKSALEAIVAYGQANTDVETGLVMDGSRVPNIPESSLGYVAACLALKTDLDRARLVLDKLLARQEASGARAGQFPWLVLPGSQPTEESLLYMGPLMGYLSRHANPDLGHDLEGRLKTAVELMYRALGQVKAQPANDTRYLLRAAARATLGAALDNEGPSTAAAEATQWQRWVTTQGLPDGHSPTFDATRLVALKWLHEMAPESQKPAVAEALLLCAVDLGLRVDPSSQFLAGAISLAYPVDYATSTGFAQYVLYTDFGQPLPERADPYLTSALLPAWRAPESVRALSEPGASALLRTRATGGNVTATDTYIGANYSLGTMSGTVTGSTLPIFLTFARTARPAAYFYCFPAPCAVQSVQQDGRSMSSFNFDLLGQGQRRQAYVRGVLGRAEDIEEVYCYGVKWNDLPTALGEQETLAFITRGCYVGVTIMRIGRADVQMGSPAKPASLRWSEEGRAGDLTLTVYARQAEYTLPRPESNIRAGVIVEVAPQTAYLTLEDFVRHLGQGQLRQSIKAVRQRVPQAEKPRDPGVILPEPQSKIDLVYRETLEQTSEYTLDGQVLTLVEDLIGNIGLSRSVNGTPLVDKLLWDSETFKYGSGQKLGEALAPFAK